MQIEISVTDFKRILYYLQYYENLMKNQGRLLSLNECNALRRAIVLRRKLEKKLP